MSTLRVHKVVSSLPGTLQADAVYAVRVGAGFDLYITDSTGALAFQANGAPAPPTWTDYATRWDAPPVSVGASTSPVAGTVLEYELGGVTRYRLVPSTYAPEDDAFYTNFAAGACTGLIASRS
jgi:hypothetical protein